MQAQLQGNAFSALTCDDDYSNDDHDESPQTPILIAAPSTPVAAPVLDHSTGQTLEHRQLRRHPQYKEVWDTSYADELGRLCQGIGQDPTAPGKQRVEGTDTFRPIMHANIPSSHRHEVTYTKVVCEVQPQKEDPNRTRITIRRHWSKNRIPRGCQAPHQQHQLPSGCQIRLLRHQELLPWHTA